MEKDIHCDTLRLIYPQWQGGIISHLVPELSEKDASLGYYLGAKLLEFLAPKSQQKTLEVPISLDYHRKVQAGVMDLNDILQQTQAALRLLEENNPKRIVTFGGECSVSVAPFTYLAKKYDNKVALLWIDAHPDINLPNDSYCGYHAMALTATMGKGEENLMKMLPAYFQSHQILIIGLRAWEGKEERQKELQIAHLTPQEVAPNSDKILQWLEKLGYSKVVVHFDLDALDPQEIIAGVGVEPQGIKINEIIRILNDIAKTYDIVGLTIAEAMPRLAIKLRNMLAQMPLLQ